MTQFKYVFAAFPPRNNTIFYFTVYKAVNNVIQGVQKVSPDFILITIVSLNKMYCMINENYKHNKNFY